MLAHGSYTYDGNAAPRGSSAIISRFAAERSDWPRCGGGGWEGGRTPGTTPRGCERGASAPTTEETRTRSGAVPSTRPETRSSEPKTGTAVRLES